MHDGSPRAMRFNSVLRDMRRKVRADRLLLLANRFLLKKCLACFKMRLEAEYKWLRWLRADIKSDGAWRGYLRPTSAKTLGSSQR